MVLESTMICIDNSEYMRNGDFVPTRLQSQHDAVQMLCTAKTRSNPENNVGLLSLSNLKVHSTLTTSVSAIMSLLSLVQPEGTAHFLTGIRIAHLALKHRQGLNHRMRIVVFIASPIDETEKELVTVAKRLKKSNVKVDVVSFGEDSVNSEKLTAFINTLNGAEGSGSHLVTVPRDSSLSAALSASPVVIGEDGSGAPPSGGFEFGIDPNDDPELALALRVSMEEQRKRQEDENKSGNVSEPMQVDSTPTPGVAEENILQQALSMSTGGMPFDRDVSQMTEEEQIQLALRMSLQAEEGMDVTETPDGKGTSTADAGATRGEDDEDDLGVDEDYENVMGDPEFLTSVLETLPGVDTDDPQIKDLIESQKKQADKNKDAEK